MKFSSKLSFTLALSLFFLLSLSQAQQAYRLLPEDTSPETHPSRQVGYQYNATSEVRLDAGTIRYFDAEVAETIAEGFYSQTRVRTTSLKVLEDSKFRLLLDMRRNYTIQLDGEDEQTVKHIDSISGKPLLIDMSKRVPTVEFEDKELVPDKEQEWHRKQFLKEYQARKKLNPWTEDLLLYGTQDRQVGESWTLKEEQLPEFNEYLTQVYLGNQGNYSMDSVEIEFLVVQEIKGVEHAILEVSGNIDVEFDDRETGFNSTTQAELIIRIERNLESYLDTRSNYTIQGKQQSLGKSEWGLSEKIECSLLVKTKAVASLPQVEEPR